jgi:chromosome segregation ATPase
MNSLIQVFARAATKSIESRVARAIIVNSTTGSTHYLETLDGKDKVTVAQMARKSAAKDFEALAAGEPIKPEKNSLAHSKSENVELEKEIAFFITQVAALKIGLASAEKRASAAEGELLSTKEILKYRKESMTRLESELRAAKASLREKEESEARLESELSAIQESYAYDEV